MKKITLSVSGMHCTSCEIFLEKNIQKLPNVEKVEVDRNKGIVEVYYEKILPEMRKIEKIIEEKGYVVWKKIQLPWISTRREDYLHVAMAGVIVFIVSMILEASGWSFGKLGDISSPTLWFALLVGLTAGVSSCMALIGGLVLGISAKWNKEHAEATILTRFFPHVVFHFWRILGFAFLWGLLGLFGSIFHISNLFLGIITGVVGVVMILLWIDLTNISPKIGSFSLKLPKVFGRKIEGRGNSHISAFLTGVATFFLPCGFTLAIQAYAISTGSFVTGALVLALFAIWTVPGLVSIGAISAALRGEWLRNFFVLTGVVVFALWALNINSGYTLVSMSLLRSPVSEKNISWTSDLEVQEIRMTQDESGYTPSTISVDAGKKVRWIITGKNEYACSSQIIVPELGISKRIEKGENIIEFVAPKNGEISFSCSMWMDRGKFVVKNGS